MNDDCATNGPRFERLLATLFPLPGYNGAMDAETKQTAKPRRRWFRFSLRTLLIVVTVLAIPLGWVGRQLLQVRRERATVTWVEEMGGKVSFPSSIANRSWWEKSTDKLFGERVERVGLSRTQVSDLSPLAKLKSLNQLHLDNTQVSDLSPLAELKSLEVLYLHIMQVSDLSPLAELKSLRRLVLKNTQVSDEQVRELKQAFPNCEIRHLMRVEK